MAVTFDLATHPTGQAGATSWTVSHTVAVQSNRILIVAVSVAFGVGTVDPTGITYAGIALTRLGSQSGNSGNISYWYLLSPATGANNCIVTFASATSWYIDGIASFYGVQKIQNGNGSFTSANNVATDTITSNSGVGNLVIDAIASNNSQAVTPGGSQTAIVNDNTSGLQAMSYASSGAGSTAMTWTGASGAFWVQFGAELVAGSQIINSQFLMFM